VLRERALESRPEVALRLDVHRPAGGTSDIGDIGEWEVQFEKRIREIASRTVAHVKRGDSVTVRASNGQIVRADRTVGADGVLRYLALLEPTFAVVEKQAQAVQKSPATDVGHAANGNANGTPAATL
jgi:hypothetical protein